MGSAIGALLHKAGNHVTLIEVARPAIDAIQSRGLIIQNKAGEKETVRVSITDQPASVGIVDLLLVFVKCYHTEISEKRIADRRTEHNRFRFRTVATAGHRRIVGKERCSAFAPAPALAPGQAARRPGKTFMGELDGSDSPRLQQIVRTFNEAGTSLTGRQVRRSRLLARTWPHCRPLPPCASLPTICSISETQSLWSCSEVVAYTNKISRSTLRNVGKHQRPAEEARPKHRVHASGCEARRQTEIDVMCGAIIEGGVRSGIATPYNRAMIGLIKGLEATFQLVA